MLLFKLGTNLTSHLDELSIVLVLIMQYSFPFFAAASLFFLVTFLINKRLFSLYSAIFSLAGTLYFFQFPLLNTIPEAFILIIGVNPSLVSSFAVVIFQFMIYRLMPPSTNGKNKSDFIFWYFMVFVLYVILVPFALDVLLIV